MTPRLLIIGLDGVGLDLVSQFAGDGNLPNLEALMKRGMSAPLESTLPPTTLPAWTSFFTGASPSSHGVPDFTVREGYRVRFVGGGSRRLPTIFSHLEQHGLTASSAWFPVTYPPERLNGYQISGWDSPVTARGDQSFVQPPELHDALLDQFGGDHLAFDTIDEFRSDEAWYRETAEALPERVCRRADMAVWLLKNRPTDVAAFYFGEADTAAHHFWAFHDPESPRRPDQIDPRLERAIIDVYRALDDAVGRLVEAAGPEAAVVVLSDHGSGGASDIAVHLNRMLEQAGLLRFRRSMLPSVSPEILRGFAPSIVPARLRRAIFHAAGGLAPARIESHLRFGGVDWGRTVAFSEELSYAPSIWFNQLGREPGGILRYRNRERAALAIERAATTMTGPDGSRLVRRVIRREDIHMGRFAHLFPDILIEFENPDGYTPICLPSRGPGTPISRLKKTDLLGRKGRSLPGCHTRNGILMAVGRSIPKNLSTTARIEDVAPLVTALSGVPAAPWFEGKCPDAVSSIDSISKHQNFFDANSSPSTYTAGEERVVAERLKRLGYLEG
ncbi:MAG: sulfatase-like hydrolase/transferase [Deltaproteobacteria bacterium]|nr:sulfatase-like hydrolase/transferase [Deltaproteobacteria bacterium]